MQLRAACRRLISIESEIANFLLNEYKVALLPGVDFYFDSDELFFRLAYLDFNGGKALKKYLKNDVPLDTKFIERFAPNIVNGIQ